MYELKYSCPIVSLMSAEKLEAHARALIITISVITGWQIPEDDTYRKILYSQFGKKLAEDYGNLNANEIEYAIRQYGTKIKDWGKNINLSLIDEALVPYVIERKQMSEMEERCAPNEQIEYESPPLDEDELIEAAKNVYLMTKKVGLISTKVYDVLVARGEIVLDVEQKKEIREAVERGLKAEAEKEGLKAVKDFVYLKNNSKDYEILVRNECKRCAVAEHFTRMNLVDGL